MFGKVLIANRGEIAMRVIRACRELGVATVAVYSEADEDCLHVRFADEAVCIGPPPPRRATSSCRRSSRPRCRPAPRRSTPGYGFLAERAAFARSAASRASSSSAPPGVDRPHGRQGRGARDDDRRRRAGHPGLGGHHRGRAEAEAVAAQIGLPVMVKASAGGGGKGIRIVKDAAELAAAVRQAQAEAEAAFGNGAVYVEKYIEAPRHIEIQVLADGKGHGIHLGERDCSIQRRHQKLIEEAPVARRRRRSCGGGWATPPSPPPWRPATRAPAPSSSCSTATAASTSWR